LLQPFLTLAASALLLGEPLSPTTILVALIVVGAVAVGRKAAVARPITEHAEHRVTDCSQQ
jgi:drug/metabolite transporter (DMT)-like permease